MRGSNPTTPLERAPSPEVQDPMRSQEEYVLRTVEERGIRFVQLWFTDVLGTPKTFSITPAELENALDEGMTFDGSAIDGFSRVQESDVLARPDANTFQLLPWHGQGHGQDHLHVDSNAQVARVFCDIVDLDGSPFQGDPRHVLKRTLDRAHAQGFTFYAAPEMEFFYFADGDPTHPPTTLDTGSYFELTVADRASDIRQRTVLTLEEMGIPVEHAQHEDAPSQHEIDLRYTDALTMADTVMTVRLVVKEMARQQGVFASFMPKPLAGVQGSGMHTHMSLFRGDQNAFVDLDRPGGLSEVAEGFIAGLLRHAGEITAITNQWVNSYKRLVVRLRGADPRVLGPQQPVRPGPGAGGQAGQDRVDPHRVPGAGQRLQPVPRLRRDPGRRPARHRAGLRAPARGRRQPVRPQPRGARRQGHPATCPGACTRR